VKVIVIIEFNIIPVGAGVSVSRFLVTALKELEKRGIKHEITPMSTIFEAENVEEAFKTITAAHEAVFKTGVKRVVTTTKIDDRRDREKKMGEKVESLKILLREGGK
jgi:uncharacterized protein (TIGR00106 family)